MNRLQLWDNQNKQWLDIMSIFFDKDGEPAKITAKLPGSNAIRDGWYNIEGEDLKKVAIQGTINLNTELIPQ